MHLQRSGEGFIPLGLDMNHCNRRHILGRSNGMHSEQSIALQSTRQSAGSEVQLEKSNSHKFRMKLVCMGLTPRLSDEMPHENSSPKRDAAQVYMNAVRYARLPAMRCDCSPGEFAGFKLIRYTSRA